MAKETNAALTIAANIDRKTFRRFAMFDAFIRRKAWRNPALFALILSAAALVCFALRRTREEAVLLGSVLLGVGLLLPLVWIGNYALSVDRQAKRLGLSADKAQYYVTLFPERLHVEKGKEKADFPWEDVHAAYRAEGCIYLYVSPTRAFLLPDSADTERAWAMIEASLEPGKLVRRNRRRA
ncbi:MAG: YcxB family protein [Firmicutes bacterium]|nr:YcxB family protein [Bacillota bacterium]